MARIHYRRGAVCLLSSVVASFHAWACECEGDMQSRFNASDVVMAGMVTEISPGTQAEWKGHNPPLAALRIEQRWKGNVDASASVVRVMIADPCTGGVEKDGMYLVYASRLANGELAATQRCGFQKLTGYQAARERRRLDRMEAEPLKATIPQPQ